jgi:hypothetical protein
MADIQTRVRWNEEEKGALAADMARLQAADHNLSLLDALRAAQQLLPAERRRDIKAWSIVEPLLGPKLAALRDGSKSLRSEGAEEISRAALPSEATASAAGMPLQSVEPSVDGSERNLPAATPPEAALDNGRLADAFVSAAPGQPRQLSAFEPLRIEAALVAALESPVVEAALVKLFSRAMSDAFAKMSAGDKTDSYEVPQQPSRRVLLAGFGAPQAKSLEEALERFEVRVWKPGQGQQLFETLASICSVAVIPESTSDDVDESLKAFSLKVLRHEGSPSRLAERIEEVC